MRQDKADIRREDDKGGERMRIKKLFRKIAAFFTGAGTLSAGKISAYLACGKKYQYQYLSAKKSYASSHYLSFANSLQDAVEVMHSGAIADLDDKELFEILKNCWKSQGYASSQQEDTFWLAGLRMLIDYVNKNRFFRNRIIAVKENVSGKFAGYLFNVRYGQVSRNPEGKIEIVQFKTGKRFQNEASLRSDIQSVINYSVARQRWGGKLGSYSVYNLYHGVKIAVEPTEKDIADCEKTVGETVKKIKLGYFTPQQGPLCSWCEYAPVCPARKLLPDPRIYKRVLESKRLAMSYSKFSLYKNCPRNYKRIYVDKIATKPRHFFSIGLSVHKAMEDLYSYDGLGEPSLKFLLESYRNNWESGGYESDEQEQAFFENGLEWMKNYYEEHVKGQWQKAWKTEPYFEAPLQGPRIGAGHLLVGFIDRIESNADGTYSIYDYKTDPLLRTQEEVDNDLQLTMYSWVCEKYFGIKIKEAALVFFRFNKIIRTARTDEDYKNMLELIDRLGEGILRNTGEAASQPKDEADKLFLPSINKYCGGCDFLDECPLKNEILQKNKSEVMNISEDLRVNDSELGPDDSGSELKNKKR
ncbi:MAG: hypothetical protein CVU78_05705 [Elusimicrobia bacterium HGW-Elusimicrobia-2]|nr:MAG: hypothetical protein CVU78_05705 [Elusimicrobia bacterium HGW-Elusimicrobia-2]